jgi:hypothetical protein
MSLEVQNRFRDRNNPDTHLVHVHFNNNRNASSNVLLGRGNPLLTKCIVQGRYCIQVRPSTTHEVANTHARTHSSWQVALS